jgi:hypothetical protein
VSRPVLLSLLSLVALVLVACSSSPEDLLDGAPDALEEAGSSRFEMRVTAVGDGIDSSYSATGEHDLATGAMRMEADLGLDTTSTETLIIGEVMYLRSPLFEIFTGEEDAWVRVDLAESGRQAGLDVDTLVEGQTGPAALLQQLRGAADEVEELGSEDVRGVSTTKLRVVVDTDRAIENSPPETREQLRAFVEASGLPSTYPMEVWIDDDGLPRRISTITEVEDPQVGVVTQQTILELFDFGVGVRVEEPEDAVEMGDLLQELDALEQELDETAPGGDPGAGQPGDPGDELDELEEQLRELEDAEG